MKRIGTLGILGALTVVALAACSLDVSKQQYEALEEQAELTSELGGGAGFCGLVQRAIEAGGMTPPLAYPVDVLERFSTEHC
jgi:hypothetical protein